jgi:hypothetical protein
MDIQRLKARIAEFAKSPKNVRFEDMAGLPDNHIRHLFAKYDHRPKGSHHVFTLSDPHRGTRTFTVVKPNSGCVKKYCVTEFLDAMEELDLYDSEE